MSKNIKLRDLCTQTQKPFLLRTQSKLQKTRKKGGTKISKNQIFRAWNCTSHKNLCPLHHMHIFIFKENMQAVLLLMLCVLQNQVSKCKISGSERLARQTHQEKRCGHSTLTKKCKCLGLRHFLRPHLPIHDIPIHIFTLNLPFSIHHRRHYRKWLLIPPPRSPRSTSVINACVSNPIKRHCILFVKSEATQNYIPQCTIQVIQLKRPNKKKQDMPRRPSSVSSFLLLLFVSSSAAFCTLFHPPRASTSPPPTRAAHTAIPAATTRLHAVPPALSWLAKLSGGAMAKNPNVLIQQGTWEINQTCVCESIYCQ